MGHRQRPECLKEYFRFSVFPFLYVIVPSTSFGLSTGGQLLANTAAMFIYAAAKKNQPIIFPKAILPGVAGGVMWSLGQVGYDNSFIVERLHIHSRRWFIANMVLSFVVSYPILSLAPCTA